MCKKSICYFCNNKAEYDQPKLDTGEIIEVCPTHFTYRYMG